MTAAGAATGATRWYKCVNGHLYAVGNCGMRAENAICNECKARI